MSNNEWTEMDLQKLAWDILTANTVNLPADPEACKECAHGASNFQKLDGAHCYMFRTLPQTLCMQFKNDHVKKPNCS